MLQLQHGQWFRPWLRGLCLWCTPSIFALQISRLGYLISTGLGRHQDPLLSRWCCSLTLDGSQHLERHFAWAVALVARQGGLVVAVSSCCSTSWSWRLRGYTVQEPARLDWADPGVAFEMRGHMPLFETPLGSYAGYPVSCSPSSTYPWYPTWVGYEPW